jgi:hypothetical protein
MGAIQIIPLASFASLVTISMDFVLEACTIASHVREKAMSAVRLSMSFRPSRRHLACHWLETSVSIVVAELLPFLPGPGHCQWRARPSLDAAC